MVFSKSHGKSRANSETAAHSREETQTTQIMMGTIDGAAPSTLFSFSRLWINDFCGPLLLRQSLSFVNPDHAD